ncbi:MAG: SMC family ATPase [Parvularcula sp.]|jgi:exonuclease SbcC|nr:SMC family ATPase [Parvularcula sp.]
MRPIKLTLSAFGPYGGTETVDFREATDAGLFGIYGPTGSGKSSIFSAIAFALFGEGAKEEQGIGTLRSDFAPDDLLTEVSLQFELGTKRYYVRRIPDQMRPKTKGEGYTAQSHAAWLFDVSDIAIDDVGPDCCGTPLAERKVSAVLSHVEEILGYGAQQFRQIVLLPQGRFERFLVSNSKDRLEILRELFDVSLYRRLTEKLKADGANVRREIEDGYRLHGHRLQTEGFASSDELTDGIASALERYEFAQLAVSETAAVLALANKAYAAAEEHEKRFVEVEAASAALKQLEAQSQTFEAMRTRKSRAELARRMSDLDTGVADARKRYRAAIEAHTNAEAAAREASDALSAASATLLDLRSRDHEIEDIARKIDQLNRHKQVLVDAAERLADLETAEGGLEQAKQTHSQAADTEAQAADLCEEKETALATAQANGLERQKLNGIRDGLKSELDAAQAFAQATQAVTLSKEACEKASAIARDAQIRHTEAVAVTETHERAFLSAQASVLAQRLQNGHPCPVCGASDHPEPAHGSGDAGALEKAWRDAQGVAHAASKADREAQAAASSAGATLDAKRAVLDGLAEPKRSASDIDGELQLILAQIDALGAHVDIGLLTQQLDDARKRKLAATETLQKARDALGGATTAEALARQAYDERIASVPENLRQQDGLQAAIDAATADLSGRKQALADADAKQRELDAIAIKAAAALQSAATAVSDTEIDLAAKQTAFESRLTELEMAEAEYRAAIPDIAEIPALEKAIASFDTALVEARARETMARNAVGNAQRQSLEPYRLSCVQAQAAADEAVQHSAAAQQKHQSLIDLQTSLAGQLENLQALEQSSGALRGIAEAFDGQNEMRTSLETFAIGAMFDQVLEAANLRLDPMTSGRYRFERDTVSVGGRSKRGLDVRVHDIETGRAREIITLSGGETFIAALSLALGLSDIVEMTNGAIRLDTIFIDEGFGSLDTDNDAGTLDQVLQVLQNIVGERRAVGLISHVPLVQQAVPNGFTVHKGANGSQIEVRSM